MNNTKLKKSFILARNVNGTIALSVTIKNILLPRTQSKNNLDTNLKIVMLIWIPMMKIVSLIKTTRVAMANRNHL